MEKAATSERKPFRTNRKDIAFLAGATRESATRLIKEFERENVLKIDRGCIQIEDHERLHKIGTMYD